MTVDERHLFGDEQSYIAWKRQQEAEARAEALKAAQARRKKRRKVKYGLRVLRAMANLRNHKYIGRLRADPEQWAACLARRSELRREWRQRNPERYRAAQRRHYERHRDWILLLRKDYHARNRDMVLTRKRQYYAEHRDECAAKSKAWYVEHREHIAAYMRTPARKARQREYDQRSERKTRQAARMRRVRALNPEKYKNYQKVHRDQNRDRYNAMWNERNAVRMQSPEYREKKRAQQLAWRASHRDEINARARAKYAAKKAAEQQDAS